MQRYAVRRSILRSLKVNCKQVSRVASQAMDRPLTLKERFGMWLHLGICDPCRQFVAQLRLLRRIIRERSESAVEDDSIRLSDIARESIKEKLQSHRHEL